MRSLSSTSQITEIHRHSDVSCCNLIFFYKKGEAHISYFYVVFLAAFVFNGFNILRYMFVKYQNRKKGQENVKYFGLHISLLHCSRITSVIF